MYLLLLLPCENFLRWNFGDSKTRLKVNFFLTKLPSWEEVVVGDGEATASEPVSAGLDALRKQIYKNTKNDPNNITQKIFRNQQKLRAILPMMMRLGQGTSFPFLFL